MAQSLVFQTRMQLTNNTAQWTQGVVKPFINVSSVTKSKVSDGEILEVPDITTVAIIRDITFTYTLT